MVPVTPAQQAQGTARPANRRYPRAGSSSSPAGLNRGNRQTRQDQYVSEAGRASARLVRCDLDQVAVRVAAIDGLDGPERAGALDRSLQNLDATIMQVPDHLVRRHGGDEADVTCPSLIVHAGRPGTRVKVGRPEIDLLSAELQGGTVIRAEILPLHAKDALVPGRGNLDILHIEDDMIDAVDGETHPVSLSRGCR